MASSPSFYDVVIVGAGPAGATAALAFQPTDLKVLLLDQAHFPREKSCGDGIPRSAVEVIRRIAPELTGFFDQLPVHFRNHRIRLATNYGEPWEMEHEAPAYTCTRLCFDDALVSLVKAHTAVEVREGERVEEAQVFPDHVLLRTAKQIYTAQVVLGCDGSRSEMAKLVRTQATDEDNPHLGAAVRAHFRGVSGVAMNRVEIFVQKDFLPGYFWLFPLPNGEVNVGFGMRNRVAHKRKLDLAHTLHDFIAASDELRDRFAQAENSRPTQSYQLPFGSQQVAISSERVMLAGDAACLVDPFSMDGISYAAHSGYLAALQAQACLREQRFDLDFIRQYDQQLWKTLGSSLRHKSWVQELAATYPGLVSLSLRLMQFAPFRQLMQRYV